MLTRWGMVPTAVPDGALRTGDHVGSRLGGDGAAARRSRDAGSWTASCWSRRSDSRPALARTPIIMLTSAGRPGDIARCHELHVDRSSARNRFDRPSCARPFWGSSIATTSCASVGCGGRDVRDGAAAPAAPDSRGRRRHGEPEAPAANAREARAPRHGGGQRAGGPRHRLGRDVRSRAHGRADASHGWPRVDGGHPAARARARTRTRPSSRSPRTPCRETRTVSSRPGWTGTSRNRWAAPSCVEAMALALSSLAVVAQEDSSQ